MNCRQYTEDYGSIAASDGILVYPQRSFNVLPADFIVFASLSVCNENDVVYLQAKFENFEISYLTTTKYLLNLVKSGLISDSVEQTLQRLN